MLCCGGGIKSGQLVLHLREPDRQTTQRTRLAAPTAGPNRRRNMPRQHSAFDPLERRLSQFQLVLRQWHGPSPVTHSPGEHRGSGAAPDFLEARVRDTDPQIQGAEIAKKCP